MRFLQYRVASLAHRVWGSRFGFCGVDRIWGTGVRTEGGWGRMGLSDNYLKVRSFRTVNSVDNISFLHLAAGTANRPQ